MKIAILGVTGSIGTSALNIISRMNEQGYEIKPVLFSAHTNGRALLDLCVKYDVKNALLTEPEAFKSAYSLFKQKGIKLFTDAAEYSHLLKTLNAERALIAQVGAAALPFLLATIEAKVQPVVANKESIVIAGDIVRRALDKNNMRILPVDSEHSAIFQCLEHVKKEHVKHLIITASGGPFYNKKESELEEVDFATASKHPVWAMGEKISIDSATLMNKALEIIEAHYLFDFAPGAIKVAIHPQSIVHSMVELIDGSVIAQMARPDMKLAISYALIYPERFSGAVRPLDFSNGLNISFNAYDKQKFKAVELAYKALDFGRGAEAVLNAANEQAVSSFKEGKIKFTHIVSVVEHALSAWNGIEIGTVDDVLRADKWAREYVADSVNKISSKK